MSPVAGAGVPWPPPLSLVPVVCWPLRSVVSSALVDVVVAGFVGILPPELGWLPSSPLSLPVSPVAGAGVPWPLPLSLVPVVSSPLPTVLSASTAAATFVFRLCKACKCASLSDASALAWPDVNVSAMSAYQVLPVAASLALPTSAGVAALIPSASFANTSSSILARVAWSWSSVCVPAWACATRSSNAAVNVLPVLGSVWLPKSVPSASFTDCNWLSSEVFLSAGNLAANWLIAVCRSRLAPVSESTEAFVWSSAVCAFCVAAAKAVVVASSYLPLALSVLAEAIRLVSSCLAACNCAGSSALILVTT